MAWGCLAVLTAYPFLTHAVTFLVAFPQDVERAIWSLLKAILFGAALWGMVWAFRVKYRRERQATATQRTGVVATDGSNESTASSGRMLVHCLAHATWTLFFSTAALYYLSSAEATADINTWGVRVLLLATVGLLGSFCIQLSWWGTQRMATVKFWASWLLVNAACAMVGIPLAMLVTSIPKPM